MEGIHFTWKLGERLVDVTSTCGLAVNCDLGKILYNSGKILYNSGVDSADWLGPAPGSGKIEGPVLASDSNWLRLQHPRWPSQLLSPRSIFIKQAVDGDVEVNLRPRYINCSPSKGTIRVHADMVDMAAQEDNKAYAVRGMQRIHVSRSGLLASDGRYKGFTLRRSMAFLKNQKAIFGSLLAVAGGATAFAYFYPYNRDVALVNLQINEADAATVKKIEDAFQRLQRADDCKSLLKKHLTNDVLDQLKHKKTKLGATLYDVIRSGIFNLDASVGVYAPDAESYKTFAALFDPIIEEYHGFSLSQKQPPVDLGEGRTADFPPLDPKNKYIVSTRIRCGRSIAGYPFNPLLTQDDYLILQQKAFLLFGCSCNWWLCGESCHIIPGDWLERKALKLRLQVKNALMSQHDDELVGTYYPLEGMSKEVQNQLIQDHFLFKDGDRHLQQANACNYWPKGRGIFHNKNKTFLVWVNEEDHVRMISMQKGSNVGEVLDRLIRGIKSLESKVGFSRDERLGWLTFCPTNLGSTIRASVHIKLPKISKRPDFKEICERLNLQVRGVHGEHSESEGGIYDVSNKARLGISEYEAVRQMYEGVKELIRLEEQQK
ncbi:unnamed protein product [Toxocara canis]|uniref:arginine kinase n=1 Tax=Toxocara canis TaxID=6265 RepID=A0A183UNE8_TOXCA|nr:unnamed protein product [Toxocara canis]